MKKVIVLNSKKLQEQIKIIKEYGISRFHVITDFDRTLTKCFVDNNKSSTLIAYMRNGRYLTPDYPDKAFALFDKYHPIEIDPKISIQEKSKKMDEWWNLHTDLLVKSGMSKEVIEDIVKKNKLHFRKGALEFIDILHEHNIPMIIMSAGPAQLIEEFLKKENRLYSNIHIIANYFIWDKNGIAIGRRSPVIHTFNKKEIQIKELSIYNELLKRKNVLLLGDSVADIDMIEGFPYENLIKIGFLNENVEEQRKDFEKSYDAIILNDGTMDYANELLK